MKRHIFVTIICISLLIPMGIDLKEIDNAVYADTQNVGNIDTTFSSHLPIIIIDQDIKESEATEIHVLENEDIDLLSSSAAIYNVNISTINNDYENIEREKKDYWFSVDGENNNSRFFSEDNSGWALLGSMFDKSLMRNYIAYSVMNSIDDTIPKPRFCELIIKNGNTYNYRGVYLLVNDSINIKERYLSAKFDSSQPTCINKSDSSGFGAIIDKKKGISVPYNQIPPEKINEIKQVFQNIDKSLSTTEPSVYLEYRKNLDESSFEDYFVLNEAFLNYYGGRNIQYSQDSQNVLKTNVAVNYEFCLDNEINMPTNKKELGMFQIPWFNKMMVNYDFLSNTTKKYKRLSRDKMSYDNVENLIDSTSSYLGEAQKRDWERWDSYYTGDIYTLEPTPGKNSYIRQTYTYEQEIIKMKNTFREHSDYIYKGLNDFSKTKDLVGEKDNYERNTTLFVVFFVIFLVSVFIVKRRMR